MVRNNFSKVWFGDQQHWQGLNLCICVAVFLGSPAQQKDLSFLEEDIGGGGGGLGCLEFKE